ncbi:MAG: zf-HC2 domain-containing protein [Candidatus Goldbacteria bacterium]|nr:zf-HC2 domain-containing protein [Candidatus Goldiibacteriota bacterium]
MSNKDCKKYKELIMEKIDGEITDNDNVQIDVHIKSCEDCRAYFRKMDKIKKAANSLVYDVPPFIEEKIMSEITGKEYKKPVFSFNFGRAFAYAVSFTLVIFVSVFLIYNKFENKTVQLSDIPSSDVVKTEVVQPSEQAGLQVIEKTTDLKSETAKEDESNVMVSEAFKTDTMTSDAVKTAETETSEHAKNPEGIQGIEKTVLNSKSIIKEESQIKPKQDYNVRKTDTTKPGVEAAKVTPISPVTSNPLLFQDKAIVANNVINPLHGDTAIIRFIVDDDAFVKIVIYDKNIRPVSVILNEQKGRGTYEATWSGKNDNNQIVSEGIYFVYIQIGTKVIKKNIIVNK